MPIQKITETETSSSPSPDTHFLVTQPEANEAGKLVESLRRIGADDIANMLKEKFGLGDTAKELASLKEDLSEYVNNVDGHFLGLSDAFEFGNITITESGWTYYTSTSRIRTKENFTLYLQAGAIIEIADSLVCYIGYKLSDGTYGLKSWFSGSYTVENDGEYVLLVRYSTESNIENILDIINGVSILVNPSADIVKLKEHTATLEKDIQNISSTASG